MKNFLIGALLVIALFLVIRPGLKVQATPGDSCVSGRFPFCADVNADGRVDISDPVATLTWLFLGGPEPTCCAEGVQGPADWVMNQAVPVPGRRSLGRFQDHGDGTVVDLLTGLEWQQRTADWVPDGVIDGRDTMSWKDAGLFVNNLSIGGKKGWRLPTVKELESIVDRTTKSPAIDPIFKDTPFKYSPQVGAPFFWSTSPVQGDTDASYGVDFELGTTGNGGGGAHGDPPNGSKWYLRAVRSP